MAVIAEKVVHSMTVYFVAFADSRVPVELPRERRVQLNVPCRVAKYHSPFADVVRSCEVVKHAIGVCYPSVAYEGEHPRDGR